MKNIQRYFSRKLVIAILFSIGMSLLAASPAQAAWPTVIYPSAAGITLGKGNTYTIQWKSVRLAAVNIDLCTEVPDGVYCFSNIAIGAPNSGSYAWTVSSNIPSGSNYMISVGIIGVSGATSRFPFTISDWAPPQEPPLAPAMMMSVNGLNVTMSWNEPATADSYILYYAAYPYTEGDPIGSIDMGNQTHFSVDLWSGAAYYVAVQSNNEVGSSEFSNVELLMMAE